jgi:hypothetical protein
MPGPLEHRGILDQVPGLPDHPRVGHLAGPVEAVAGIHGLPVNYRCADDLPPSRYLEGAGHVRVVLVE